MNTSRSARVRLLVLLAATVTALVTAAPPALARDAPAPAGADEFRWAVQPSSPTGPTGRNQFIYDLAPGQQIDDHVAVTNLSAKPLTFTVYPTDAFTAVDGAFALLPASQPARDTGNWVGLDRKPLTVRPGQRVVVPFRLTVPKNAAPGDHAAGIVASVTEERVDGDGQRVNVDRRVAARIYLRVAGPVTPSAEIESAQVTYDNPVLPFARGAMTITYRVRNTGNVRVGGKVWLRATGLLGVPLSGTQGIDLPEMLPGSQVTLTRRLDGVWPAGLVTGAVTVEPTTSQGALPELVRTSSALTPPWTLLYLLLAVGILLLVRWWRRAASASGGPVRWWRRRAAGASGGPAAPDVADPAAPRQADDTRATDRTLGTDAAAVDNPAVDAPAAGTPVAVDNPAVDAPAAGTPVAVDNPAVGDPVAGTPAVDAPAVDARA